MNHNRPLYITVKAKKLPIPRAFVSSINIIPLFFLDSLGLPRDGILPDPLIIHGVGNMTQKSIGYIKLEVAVGGLRGTHRFEVVDFRPSYHM